MSSTFARVEQNITEMDHYIDRRQKKKDRKASGRNRQQDGLTLREISPLNDSQSKAFKAYNSGMNAVLHGCAGTGKTFLSSYLAIRDIMNKVEQKQQLIIVRSVVPSRDMGFLPGSITEKAKIYEEPYRAIFTDLFGRGDAYEVLKQKQKVIFTTTSFVRGQTWDDAIVIVDEFQNLSWQELNTVITRVGENSRIIFSGDGKQDDLTSERYNTQSGASKFISVLSRMDSFASIDFGPDDIVRSDFVREYIKTCYDMGIYS
jgi:phosphate starvation-inducible protein PhoH